MTSQCKHNWNELFEYRDGKLYWKIRASMQAKVGNEAGYKERDGYVRVRFKRKAYPVHRIIWEMHNGSLSVGMEIDHKNRVRDDNALSNLRVATDKDNSRNRKMLSSNTSGYKGVSYFKRDSLWHARIGINGRNKFLGAFETAEAASEAYRLAVKRTFGNFIPEFKKV